MAPPDRPTHAGGIVARIVEGTPVYLLVTARRNRRHWLFPKGHIDPGEAAEAAAAREVREESGVEAAAVREVGVSEYVKDGAVIRTVYFLMDYRGETSAEEDRGFRWCPYEEARQRLSFEDLRRLLTQAHTGPTQAPSHPA
ncbi:MAG TPA: NUDIX domain-containing protein [Methylomirabilota bacterium]|nr:NUDIX domain-containing protein [Methylomirabilota bacterium]